MYVTHLLLKLSGLKSLINEARLAGRDYFRPLITMAVYIIHIIQCEIPWNPNLVYYHSQYTQKVSFKYLFNYM